MSLRRAVLLAFVLLGVLPSVAVSWLSFSRTRSAMEAKISQGLSAQAQSLQADIDTLLFERFQNAVVWSQSELMQDLRFGDVDKRVSGYLVGLAQGYGDVYLGLQCWREDGQILASAQAREIGQAAPALSAVQASVHTQLPGGQATLYLPAHTRAGDAEPMWIDTAIAASSVGPHPPNIHLRLAFNPAHLSRMLDSVASGGRQALVVDAQGRWVAASQGLRSLNLPTAQQDLAGLALAQASASAPARAVPWSAQPQLLGRGLSQANPAFAGSHWTTLVLQPVDEALAPIDAVAQAFWAVLVVVLLATLAAGAWGAARIVRPVAALTEATQRYQREGRLPAANAARSHISEIDALGRAYLAMMASVQQSRRELVRSAKLAMLGEFAAVMAHEVRTPLGILRSSAQVLLREPGLSANSRELMGFIESETERLNRLVNTLLDTARPRPPAFGPCDLNEVVQRCLQMQAVRHSEPGPHPAMQLDLQAQAPQLQADAEQLMQAIFNLLSNALQAAGPQGQVRLSTADAGEWLQLRCEDDGPGIAPAVAEHLFDPFVSGREGGIGLGLAVVRQIVDAHGGRISVGQGALGGAAFTVLLPRQHMADAIQKGCP